MNKNFLSVNLPYGQTDNGPRVAEIYLIGTLGQYQELSYGSFVAALNKAMKMSDAINLRVHSPGGSIPEGLAIYNAIKQCKKPVYAYVEGLAASMASVFICGAKKVYMSNISEIMTHQGQWQVQGQANQLQQYADILRGFNSQIASVYAAKTGLSPQQVEEKLMPDGRDVWLNAQQALTHGLCDEIYTSEVSAPAALATDLPNKIKYFEQALPAANTSFFNKTKHMEHLTNHLHSIVAALNLQADANNPNDVIDKAKAMQQAQAKLVSEQQAQIEQLQAKLAEAENAGILEAIAQAVDARKINNAQAEVFKNMLNQGLAQAVTQLLALAEPVPNLATEAKATATQAGADSTKNLNWYRRNAPKQLLAMRNDNPEAYNQLVKNSL